MDFSQTESSDDMEVRESSNLVHLTILARDPIMSELAWAHTESSIDQAFLMHKLRPAAVPLGYYFFSSLVSDGAVATQLSHITDGQGGPRKSDTPEQRRESL